MVKQLITVTGVLYLIFLVSSHETYGEAVMEVKADVMSSRLQVETGSDIQTSSVMNEMGQWDSSGCAIEWNMFGKAGQHSKKLENNIVASCFAAVIPV
jgi:hypothetical protein